MNINISLFMYLMYPQRVPVLILGKITCFAYLCRVMLCLCPRSVSVLLSLQNLKVQIHF